MWHWMTLESPTKSSVIANVWTLCNNHTAKATCFMLPPIPGTTSLMHPGNQITWASATFSAVSSWPLRLMAHHQVAQKSGSNRSSIQKMGHKTGTTKCFLRNIKHLSSSSRLKRRSCRFFWRDFHDGTDENSPIYRSSSHCSLNL